MKISLHQRAEAKSPKSKSQFLFNYIAEQWLPVKKKKHF